MVITMKKAACLQNIFDSRLYRFISFTFYLKPSHKICFTVFTISLKHKVKIFWGKK